MRKIILGLLFLFILNSIGTAKISTYFCYDYGVTNPNFYKNEFNENEKERPYINPLNRCEYSGYNQITEIPENVFKKLNYLENEYFKVLKDNNDFRNFFGVKDWTKSKEHLQNYNEKVKRTFEESKLEINEYNLNRVQIVKLELENQKKVEAEIKYKKDLERTAALEKDYGKSCRFYSKGSDKYKNCLLEQDKITKETESKKILAKQEQERKQLETEQTKRKAAEDKQKEETIKIAKMSPDDRRAYTCSEKFGFRKGSDNFKECVFKIYSAEIELEKIELQKQLAKANADLAKANAASNQKLADAQTAAAIMQAYAAQQQAIAANTADSLALMESGLRMMSPQRPAARAPMNCQYHAKMLSCF